MLCECVFFHYRRCRCRSLSSAHFSSTEIYFVPEMTKQYYIGDHTWAPRTRCSNTCIYESICVAQHLYDMNDTLTGNRWWVIWLYAFSSVLLFFVDLDNVSYRVFTLTHSFIFLVVAKDDLHIRNQIAKQVIVAIVMAEHVCVCSHTSVLSDS